MPIADTNAPIQLYYRTANSNVTDTVTVTQLKTHSSLISLGGLYVQTSTLYKIIWLSCLKDVLLHVRSVDIIYFYSQSYLFCIQIFLWCAVDDVHSFHSSGGSRVAIRTLSSRRADWSEKFWKALQHRDCLQTFKLGQKMGEMSSVTFASFIQSLRVLIFLRHWHILLHVICVMLYTVICAMHMKRLDNNSYIRKMTKLDFYCQVCMYQVK